jgi:hypothetical protein
MIAHAFEQEDLARPGAGDDIRKPITVKVRNMRAKSDASATRDDAVLAARLELRSRSQLRLSVRARIVKDPEGSTSELADEQVLHAVAIEIGDARSGVAGIRVDWLAVGFDANGRLQSVAQRHRPRGRRREEDHECFQYHDITS